MTLVVYFDSIKKKVIVAPISINKEGFKVVPGNVKKSEICKILKEKFEKKGHKVSVDDLMSLLPPGDCELKN